MQISSNTNYKTPNFKQVSLIKVAKKAFKNPENYLECEDIFDRAMGKLLNQVELTSMQKSLALSGILQPIKFISVLESPGLAHLKTFLKRKGEKSLEWLKNTTGMNIPNPLSKDYHSFFVLFNGDQHAYLNKLGYGGIADCINKAYEDTKYDMSEEAIPKGYVKLSEFINEKFNQIINKKPIQEFKIESLDELKNITEKLDVRL